MNSDAMRDYFNHHFDRLTKGIEQIQKDLTPAPRQRSISSRLDALETDIALLKHCVISLEERLQKLEKR